MTEKRLYSFRLMFNNLTKPTAFLTKENPVKQILFISVGIRAVLKILVSVKNRR